MDDRTIQRARTLRRNMTDAERRLWSRLRRRQIGWHFRRQAAIGRFIVDFVCFEAALLIEIDGGQHARAEAADSARTAWLERQGFRVVRFWNNDVLANTDGVVQTIRRILDGPAPP